jgi:hypothetical protein
MKLTIHCSRAKDLNSADSSGGHSDPYAKVELKTVKLQVIKKYKTKTVKKTLNPTWDEKFLFTDVPQDSKIVIKLFNHHHQDKVGKHDTLGNIQIPITQLIQKTLSGQDDSWFDVTAGGQVFLKWEFDPSPTQANTAQMQAPAKLEKSTISFRSPRSDTQHLHIKFTVNISNIRCKNLPAMDGNGLTDCYILFDFDGTKFKTEPVFKDLNPVFPFTKEFPFMLKFKEGSLEKKLAKKSFKMEFWDKDKGLTNPDAKIGHIQIPIAIILNGPVHQYHHINIEDNSKVMFDIMVNQETQTIIKFAQLKQGLNLDNSRYFSKWTKFPNRI